MLQVNNGEIIIHKGDAFSLLCMSDYENIEAERLNFYVVDEENNIILKKTAKNYENGVYFVFNSDDTKLSPNVYNYFVQYTIDEQNVITTNNNTLKVRQSV